MSASRAHRDVKASGVRLRVAVAGNGPPVIFLHGLFANHASWLPVREALGEQFTAVIPDFPGFGESEKPPASRFAYSIDAFAETIADLYAGLDLGRAAVVGHGLGGAVALALTAQHPELVSRLVLVDALCYEAPADISRRIALIPIVGGFIFKQLWGRSTFRSFYRSQVLSGADRPSNELLDEYFDAFNSPASRGSALATMRATSDTRAVVAHTVRITAATLVVWGRHDRIYPARLGQRLAREIRGAGFQLMDAGHAPHEQHPEAFASILARFLRAERPTRT